jgi:hypothetical protein
VRRWRAATAALWRAEPALALGLYFLLAVATVGYIHLFGPPLRTRAAQGMITWGLLTKYGAVWGLAEYAFFTWRMWLGGGLSWSLSLLWKLASVGAIAVACYRTPSPFLFGLLALTIAGVVPLFAPAVLDRVDNSGRQPRSWRGSRRFRAASS